GDVTEQVRVVAEAAAVVETDTPSIKNSISYNLQVKAANSTGNRPWEMLTTVPAFQSGASAFVYSIAGSRGAQNEFLIDGIASPGGGSALGSTSMSTSATVEIQVHAVNNGAEHSQPGIYEQISRSGTNKLHGQVRYFHSNSALNSRSPLSPVKASSREHQFGLWIGGPVRFPWLYNGRDRTFFMLAYDGGRTPNQQNVIANVPTAAMRAGDFTGLAAINDPLTGQRFPNNRIPEQRISSVSRNFQERFYPLPNFGNLALPGPSNFQTLFNNSGRFDHPDFRLDHRLTKANTIYGRLGYQQFPVRVTEPNIPGGTGLPPIGRRSQLREFWSAVISDTHIFSPTLINEARIGFVRSLNPFHGPQRGLEVIAAVGLQGIASAPDAFGMPRIGIVGFTEISQIREAVEVEQSGQFTDALTWVHRRHTWKMGVDLRRATPNITNIPVGAHGNFIFTNAFSGNAYANFLLGLPQESLHTPADPPSYRRQSDWGLFVQDDFKVNSRLTLQLGLRYEYQKPLRHLLDTLYNFDLASGGLVLASERSRSSVSPLFDPRIPISVADGSRFPVGRLWHSDRNNFAPRLGFALRPTASSDFAIRGGWAVFYDKFGYGIATPFLGGPFTAVSDRFVNSITGGVPLFQFPNPFPAAQAGPSTTTPIVNAVLPDLRNPYVQQWNLTVERGKWNTGFRASYIGTKGTGLPYQRNVNVPAPSPTPFSQSRRPYPLYGDILLVDQGANSIYHGLQLEARRRVESLTFNLGYTWGNTISDAADTAGGTDVAAKIENPFDRRAERGRETYAIRHRFVASAVWQIPVGKGRHFLSAMPGWANQVLGGWEMIGVAYLQTGNWFTPVFSGSDPSNTNTVGGRPDRVASGKLSNPDLTRWFDPSAFVAPPVNSGRFGNSGRNILEGPGVKVLHLTVAKDFPIYETVKVTFQVAARNIFNHPNFGLPATDIHNANVAKITSFPEDLLSGRFRTIQARLLLSW
ncbi:MAG: TonB-dependent receptor domain-containing protein, partial [Gammaproteobacteria bacterium]